MASRKKQPPREKASKPRNKAADQHDEGVIIDGVAEHLDETPDTGKKKPADSPKKKPDISPSGKSPLILASLGIGVIISLVLGGLTMIETMRRPDMSVLIAPLNKKISLLEEQLNTTSTADQDFILNSDLDQLARRLDADIAALTNAVETLAATPQAQNDITLDLTAVIDRVNLLEQKLDKIAGQLATAQSAREIEPTPPAETVTPPTDQSETGKQEQPSSFWHSVFGDMFRISRIDDEAN